MKETIGEIFTAVLLLLKDAELIQLENYFVDGTKVEANPSKDTFVWARNTAPQPLDTAFWLYDLESDTFTYPNGQFLSCLHIRQERTDNGYASEERAYVCE